MRALRKAWAVVDESVLPDLSRAVWNGNGLRVGLLPAGQGGVFMSALGEVDKTRDVQILSYDFLEELRASPPLNAAFYADLTLPPLPVQHETLTGGTLRMLMASRPLGNGITRVTLTPQHHVPKTTLLPRSPQQRVLDGRVYDELSVQIDVSYDQVLVMGFFEIAPPVAEVSSSDEAAVEEDVADDTQAHPMMRQQRQPSRCPHPSTTATENNHHLQKSPKKYSPRSRSAAAC